MDSRPNRSPLNLSLLDSIVISPNDFLIADATLGIVPTEANYSPAVILLRENICRLEDIMAGRLDGRDGAVAGR